ncbi:MAG: hypothetical protein JSS23_12280 [Proteobacteria bacterium]|nr:hypothetical protein [Pseudomonadota bacterium]
MSVHTDRAEDIMSGGAGGLYITDTAAKTGDWVCIKAITATTFTTLTSTGEGAITGPNLNTITLAAGDTLHGRFQAITLASGKVIAYNRPGGRP